MARAAKVAPAVERVFRVMWYEVPANSSVLVRNATGLQARAPKQAPRRKGLFDVRARSVDVARQRAREHVKKQGANVISVNLTTQEDGIVVYSKEKS